MNNFDEIRETVVRDQKLAFEMFKKGDIDDYYVNVSREWVEEMNFDRVQRGLIQKRKIFNDAPSGFGGLAFNTRKAPFDDLRVRKGLTLLMNRDELIKRLFFNEYVPLHSYYAGGIYENPNNPKNLQPAGGARAARRGRLEGPRRAGPAREERPAAHPRTALRQQGERDLDDGTRRICARSALR